MKATKIKIKQALNIFLKEVKIIISSWNVSINVN